MRKFNISKIYFNTLHVKINLEPCFFCKKLFQLNQMTNLSLKQIDNPKISQKFRLECDEHVPINICKNFCYKHIFAENRIPIYSSLNKMFLQSPPNEIACLNFYEKFNDIKKIRFHKIIIIYF